MASEPDRAQRIRQRYREVFEGCCAREKIAARIATRITGQPTRFEFDGQEGASGALILEHFLIELGKQGVAGGQFLQPEPAATEAEIEQHCRALERALARVRTLLVEFNSYLSGGLPYVFPTDSEVLRRRGLVVYRYPARGAVEVSASGERVRIAFAAGELGDVTSSGFYVPTRVEGDFEARVAYELARWVPGPDSACLALFAQNEPSTLRYYAQISSWGTPPALFAQASFNGETRAPVAIDERAGEFRLRRRDGGLAAWHRARGQDWTPLGEREGEPRDELVIGCKIWSKVSCGGLVADLSGLALEGTLSCDQGPLPAVRPDPRSIR